MQSVMQGKEVEAVVVESTCALQQAFETPWTPEHELSPHVPSFGMATEISGGMDPLEHPTHVRGQEFRIGAVRTDRRP